MPRRILITGSRNWTSYPLIAKALIEARDDAELTGSGRMVLIHGGATGADTIAAAWATEWGWGVECYPADWNGLGKAAGPVRNQQMVNTGADVCLAFPLSDSRGTWDCVRRAGVAGIPVRIIEPKES